MIISSNVPRALRSNVPRATRPHLFLIFLLFFPSLLSADSAVTISILSILQPTELTITLLHPDRAMLQTGLSTTAISAQAPINVKLQRNRLVLDSNIATESLNIDCPNFCVFEIAGPGVPPHRRYAGNLILTAKLSTINIVLQTDEQKLLTSIVASEMGESRHREALKAFTIVSRSFLRLRGRHPELAADFCDLTHCQVFQSDSPSTEARNAERDTAELILKYRNHAFRPYYSRSCGGTTATFEEVWGEKSPDYPFSSTKCRCNTPWSVRINVAESTQIFGMPVKHAVQREKVLTINGQLSFRLEEFRILVGRALGWNRVLSNAFVARQNGADLVIEGNGIGHRVGFCQNGAFEMSKQGRSYQEILRHYFPNTEIRSGS